MCSPQRCETAESAPTGQMGLLGATAASSTAAVTLNPSLSPLSPDIMSPRGVDVAANKGGGRRSNQHRFLSHCCRHFYMHTGCLSGGTLNSPLKQKRIQTPAVDAFRRGSTLNLFDVYSTYF